MKDAENVAPGSPEHITATPLPLSGRTVMVTRNRSQAGEITSLLEGLGATVTHCPTIEVVAPDDWAPLDRVLDELNHYDWAIFTSANGVRFFLKRLVEKKGGAASFPGNLLTCAIGPATAGAMTSSGFRVDLIPDESVAEGALRAIIDRAGGEEKIRGLKFLLPRARVARDYLPAALGRLGAQVDAVEAYQTVKPDIDGEAILSRIKEGGISAITFTSSSTVSNFADLVGLKDLSVLLRDIRVACIGPVTAATAARYGLEEVIQPEIYTAAAMVEALRQAIE